MQDHGIAAACYARMSTDMQCYSVRNQCDAIAFYAARRGYRIVRSYIDEGRSGLRIDRRAALQRLLADVVSGRADFQVILVYDVSRWGRFQDSDEAAHYEYLCKKAGVAVHYCAESFDNDGSLFATLLKNLKRAMAAEFSRELSVKVHAGQSRLTALGYRVCGAAGFGLQKSLIDEHGHPTVRLSPGQRKSIKSDRVVLVPGPPDEIRTVRRVYDLFIREKRSMASIARTLNAQGSCNVTGNPWTALAIKNLLTNEKYIGNSVYNRTSRTLGLNCRINPESAWVRKAGAFAPLVPERDFALAKRQQMENAGSYGDNEMLDYLSAIWCREKHLSREIIDASVAPSTNCYRAHFGSLSNAYARIGFITARNAGFDATFRIRKDLCRTIAQQVRIMGGTAGEQAGRGCQIWINKTFWVSVVVGRASPASVSRNHNQWRLGYRTRRKPDVLVVARVDAGQHAPRDFYILPYLFQPDGSWLTVSGRNYRRLESYRADSLQPLYRLCALSPAGGPA
jgi:DNA invertase Pin-like site-specific DNA recombinase